GTGATDSGGAVSTPPPSGVHGTKPARATSSRSSSAASSRAPAGSTTSLSTRSPALALERRLEAASSTRTPIAMAASNSTSVTPRSRRRAPVPRGDRTSDTVTRHPRSPRSPAEGTRQWRLADAAALRLDAHRHGPKVTGGVMAGAGDLAGCDRRPRLQAAAAGQLRQHPRQRQLVFGGGRDLADLHRLARGT